MSSSLVDSNLIVSLIYSAFPHRRIETAVPLRGGLINNNLKITFASGEAPVVLRLYRTEPATCLKEVAVLRLVRNSVPVPEVVHVESHGVDGSPPFAILEFVDGLTFQQLERTHNLTAIQQAAESIGATLAAIGRFEFDKAGRLTATNGHLEVGAPYIDGPDPVPAILDTFLKSPNLKNRLGTTLLRRIHDFTWKWAPLLPDLSGDCSLVHSDFGNRNILVHEVSETWKVAAVLDWEFAFSGSPLLDVGHFLRYEEESRVREPYFSRAFVENGGKLPERWPDIVRVIDLTGLVECLTHDRVPDDVVVEIIGLIESTLEYCQPT